MDDVVFDQAGNAEVVAGPAAGLQARSRVRHGEVWVATTPVATADEARTRALPVLLRAAVEQAKGSGAEAVHWETDDGIEVVDPVAAAAGFDQARDILQLRRSLPLESSLITPGSDVATRPLRPGTADEAAWVRCNNRAFAHHPDQGHETVDSLRATMAAPWFDANDLLVIDGVPGVDAGGGLDGFCWTKRHAPAADDPAIGEIYVIGVDPSAAGHGLGRALVVAGLIHLTERGLRAAMLYVDDSNESARRLYDRLGFTLHHTRRVRTVALR